MEKSSVYYLKAGIFSVILAIESFFLTKVLLSYVNSKKYFTPELNITLAILILQILILFTNAILCAAWSKWEQYVFGPISIAIGILIPMIKLNLQAAGLLLILIFTIQTYNLLLANLVKIQLIKFNARLILKPVAKGIIFIFSIVAATLVLVTSQGKPQIDLSYTVGQIVQKFVEPAITRNLQIEAGNISDSQMNYLKTFGVDPARIDFIRNSGLLENVTQQTMPDLGIAEMAAKEAAEKLEPYEDFVNPVIAFAVFGLMQFIGTFAYYFFAIFIGTFFNLFKTLGVIKTIMVPTEKEVLSF